MQTWLNPVSPTRDDVSSRLDGFAFVLEEKAAEKCCNSPIVNEHRASRTVTLSGHVPPELWCRLGTQVLPQLGQGGNVRIGIEISAKVQAGHARRLEAELRQILSGLGLTHSISVEV